MKDSDFDKLINNLIGSAVKARDFRSFMACVEGSAWLEAGIAPVADTTDLYVLRVLLDTAVRCPHREPKTAFDWIYTQGVCILCPQVPLDKFLVTWAKKTTEFMINEELRNKYE